MKQVGFAKSSINLTTYLVIPVQLYMALLTVNISRNILLVFNEVV